MSRNVPRCLELLCLQVLTIEAENSRIFPSRALSVLRVTRSHENALNSRCITLDRSYVFNGKVGFVDDPWLLTWTSS